MRRRSFVERSLFAGASLILGCSDDEPPRGGTGGHGGSADCDDALSDAELLGQADFVEPVSATLDQKTGEGLEGRLVTDLSTLDEGALITDNERFYIRTAASDLLVTDDWHIALDGLVTTPRSVPIDYLRQRVEPQGVHLLECSGNYAGGGFGLMSAADWSGIPLQQVLAMVEPLSSATRVLINGFDEYTTLNPNSISTPGASWVFTPAQLEGAFLATEMNGVPLPLDHGFPVRLINPGWFGCCNIKWVDRIAFVDDGEPATSQMQEFAERTLQPGTPALAKDYLPATIDQTAVPLRVEKWQAQSGIVYRLVGVMWGGYALTDALAIAFDGGAHERVTLCPPHQTNASWTLWRHLWRPPAPGRYAVSMHIDDPGVPQRRLDSGRYVREVIIDEV